MKHFILLLLFSLFSLYGCKAKPELKMVRVAIARVELTVSSVNSGTVKAEHEAELAFGTVGRVSRLVAHAGMTVSKDQVLAELENTDLLTAYETAQQDVQRSQELLKSRVTTKQEAEQYRRTFDLARGNYEKSLIRVPFSGLITEVNLEVGQLSQITAVIPKPLIKIVDLEPRYIQAEIDEVDLPSVTPGLPARAKILAVRREPFHATVRRVVPYVSTIREQDRTSLLELDVDSEGISLPAGASADIEIIATAKDQVLAIPARIVLGRGTDRYVYRFLNGRTVKTPIKIGIGNYDRTEVIAGLAADESVLFPAEDVELEDGLRVNATVLPWP